MLTAEIEAFRQVTGYDIAAGQGFDQACDLLAADYDGVLITDGWGPYRSYEAATHQTCCPHLLLRATEMVADLPD